VQLHGSEILIRDLNSTNGSFINGEKITEKVLKPGQTLRLGQVELKLEAEGAAAASPNSPAPAPAPVKKQVDATMIMPRGVSLDQLEQGGARPPGFDTNTAFSKKTNKVNKVFVIGGILIGLLIDCVFVDAGQSPEINSVRHENRAYQKKRSRADAS
jgi:pSer/pThr/pTyr-binding forkhead associated (FHA) protein